MAKYKPQIRQDETTVVDLDLCAKYDGEGNDIVATYAKKGESGTAASNTVPKAAGTAAIGTELAFARGDHVHPAQENISGNAGTATKLAAARTITLSGDVSGSIIFDGSKNVTITTTVNAISTEDINTICSQVILNSEDVDL